MKKILFILITMFMLPLSVFASGDVTLNKNSIELSNGESTTFIITATNSAGKITITSSNINVITVDKSSEWLDNNSIKVTVKSKSVGKATININVDAATYSEEVIKKNYTISVTVNQPKSSNNNLASLSVSDLSLRFDKNTTNYVLEAKHTQNSIIINASPEDSAAKVSGTGTKTLKDGKNIFDVIVTAENGSTKKYEIIINRKNEYGTLYELSSDNNIKTLSIGGYEINFSPNINKYYLEVDKNVNSLNFDIVLSDSKATYNILNNDNFNKNINEVTIKVISEDKKEKLYTFVVLKKDILIENNPINENKCENEKQKSNFNVFFIISIIELIIIIAYLVLNKIKQKKEQKKPIMVIDDLNK